MFGRLPNHHTNHAHRKIGDVCNQKSVKFWLHTTVLIQHSLQFQILQNLTMRLKSYSTLHAKFTRVITWKIRMYVKEKTHPRRHLTHTQRQSFHFHLQTFPALYPLKTSRLAWEKVPVKLHSAVSSNSISNAAFFSGRFSLKNFCKSIQLWPWFCSSELCISWMFSVWPATVREPCPTTQLLKTETWYCLVRTLSKILLQNLPASLPFNFWLH